MKYTGVWVYVVGILMFIWGFCQLGYAFMDFHLPITIPFTEWGSILGEEELFSDVQLGLAFSCIFSGIGMLIFNRWSRILAIWIIWTFSAFFFYIFLLVGPLEFEEFFVQKFAVFFTISLILLWFFNQEKTREILNSEPAKKHNRLIPFFTFLQIALGLFVYINLSAQLPLIFKNAKFPEIQSVNYVPEKKHFYKAQYERTEFPLPFTMAVPIGTTLVSLNQVSGFGKNQCDIHLQTPGRAEMIFLSRQTPVQQEWGSSQTQEFFDRIHSLTPYAYARKIFSDRNSIIYWRARNELGQWGGDEIHEVNMSGLQGFVVKAEKPGELFEKPIRWYFDFNLYIKEKDAGGGKIFVMKGGQKISSSILATLEPRWNKNKTAFDFHQDGLGWVKKKNYEKAKMSFASALCMDENNPDYHYSLGKVFYSVSEFEQADRHLTKAMVLNVEPPEAKELFIKIRKKLGKPEQLDSKEKV